MWTNRSGVMLRMASNTRLFEPVVAHEANATRNENGLPSAVHVRKRPSMRAPNGVSTL